MSSFSGLLGKALLPAAVEKELCQVPADVPSGTVTVCFCNTSADPARVRLAITAKVSPSAEDYLEFDYQLPGNSPLERGGIAVSPGERVFCRSDAAGVSVRVHGYGDEK